MRPEDKDTATSLRCLLIRQPYASLIVDGIKRWEFRHYPSPYYGRIALAATRGYPLRTHSEQLNNVAPELPRGVVIGTARLTSCRKCTPEVLRCYVNQTVEVDIMGTKIKVVESPIGEPVEDVLAAIQDPLWHSHAWELVDVTSLDKPVQYAHAGRGTWGTVKLT